MEMKTQLEIDALKRSWQRDPCWDIEETEGFEEHKEELLTFRKETEAQWATARQKRHDELASKVCPIMSAAMSLTWHTVSEPDVQFVGCQVEKCAWWNKTEGMCVIRALTLRG